MAAQQNKWNQQQQHLLQQQMFYANTSSAAGGVNRRVTFEDAVLATAMGLHGLGLVYNSKLGVYTRSLLYYFD